MKAKLTLSVCIQFQRNVFCVDVRMVFKFLKNNCSNWILISKSTLRNIGGAFELLLRVVQNEFSTIRNLNGKNFGETACVT